MTGPCTAHPWRVAVARCNSCGDSLCAYCRAPLGGTDGTSRCVDCAAAELLAAVDNRKGLAKLFRRKPAPAALVPVAPIEQPAEPHERISSLPEPAHRARPHRSGGTRRRAPRPPAAPARATSSDNRERMRVVAAPDRS